MTQEEKSILLRDLCARLPYGVKCLHPKTKEIVIIKNLNLYAGVVDMMPAFKVEESKLYLRPMSSMTEEEFKEVSEIDRKRIIFSARHLTWHIDGEVIDFFNRKMLDWRGLISMGLALSAPEDMYKKK